MRYWLLKSEPAVYSIDDLAREKTALWDGVRNYQARNHLRAMQVGDLAFFYHSSTKPPGIVGLCQVVEVGLADPTQFDPSSPYFDPRSNPQSPRWWTVRVAFIEKFQRPLTLHQLRAHFSPSELPALRRGNRLSVMPIEPEVAGQIERLARTP
ncbi:MAG: EVE domain-containing protein [Meiothermus sp.]|uniref:EVE domain-containing protein n=1 Tax=Meiothermus sp. TaxID=1955249 RepID=UPI0025D378C0|nr:EVE domain-containing protein [Meiothermus sp.]MCS7058412.1 EVE domain-containing protein [Meiothermus sp.]MCS7195460.1 EVE domain-containing protein [Meiothermus sp.]MCX7739685.1 EVE domain-containing protein [Meiothermus sp.]MDW8089800.1 EVE domain-containing protein [Meiothermus sp.]MDW8481775.1 EVE domain-containing protein [Meiothermus sp.]